jgi:hypothetical protein
MKTELKNYYFNIFFIYTINFYAHIDIVLNTKIILETFLNKNNVDITILNNTK